jgi:hypothetical protein
MSLNCRAEAQRDIFAVTVSLAGEIGLEDDTVAPFLFNPLFNRLIYSDVFWILEWQECHEISVMHDERFRRALDQIAFGGVGCDDVADGIGNAAFERECDASEGMAQSFSAFALTTLAVGPNRRL